MPKVYTLDASVFLNAFFPREAGHAASADFLARLRAQAIPIVLPTLVLPEVAATIARAQQDAEAARSFAIALSRLSNVVLVALDDSLARQAVDVAAEHHLRGSDAVYAAVALRFGSALVTLDREQRARMIPALSTSDPSEALAQLDT